ncbi:hypothetical protein [Niveispirillum sp. SYP-B3756]|nr:hypothetical protein [Niveispirillum sp. SYP-B3756]
MPERFNLCQCDTINSATPDKPGQCQRQPPLDGQDNGILPNGSLF